MTTISKKENRLPKFFVKNKPVESTDYENWLAWCNIDENISQNTDEGSDSKVEKRKFQDVSQSEFPWLIDDFNKYVMHCYVSRKAGPDIAGKTEFVTGKKFKHKSLVYQNKNRTVSNLTEWYPPLAILWCSNFGIQVY